MIFDGFWNGYRLEGSAALESLAISVLEAFAEANGTMHYEVEDWDLATLPVGEPIVGLPSTLPFKFKFDLF